jgi:PX domain
MGNKLLTKSLFDKSFSKCVDHMLMFNTRLYLYVLYNMEDNEYEKEQYAYAGSSPHTPITIKITNPIIKDDRFSKHVTYTIIGEDNKGPFEAQRRYKEFNSIQHLLNTQWPGCYIPQIPGKKAIVCYI